MAHTPGPWLVSEGSPDHAVIAGNKLLAIVTQDEDEPIDDGEQFANARLIAAAPELLEALKDAYAALDYAQAQADSDADRMHLTRCRRKIKPVIDKAEGRSE